MDRANIDLVRFNNWSEKGIFFVTRTKSNMSFHVLKEHGPPRPVGRPRSSDKGNKLSDAKGHVVSDKTVVMASAESYRKCMRKLRLVANYDAVSKRTFTFLTNSFKLSAQTIADLYKQRWLIESFFKDLKQNLNVKTFYGTSENAAKLQIWTALIAMLMMRLHPVQGPVRVGLVQRHRRSASDVPLPPRHHAPPEIPGEEMGAARKGGATSPFNPLFAFPERRDE
jgi:hypothetical protein